MSGLRFGVLYTENQHVATAVASLCRYHGLSGLVQHQMAQLLRDHGDCLGLGTWKRSGGGISGGLVGAHGCLPVEELRWCLRVISGSRLYSVACFLPR